MQGVLGWLMFLCCPHLPGPEGLSPTQGCSPKILGTPSLLSMNGPCCRVRLSLFRRELWAVGGDTWLQQQLLVLEAQ